MRNRLRTLTLLGTVAACSALSGFSQPIGQWDFDSGTLNGTVGEAMTFGDDATRSGAVFNTTTSFGIPNIGGAPANVLRVPASETPSGGLIMPVESGAVGGDLVNSYTLIMDVLFPPESSSKRRALLQVESQLGADAELLVNENNAIGGDGAFHGFLSPNTWHRIGFVADAETGTIRKYIDGALVGSQSLGPVDDRYALSPNGTAFLFNDDDGESELAYVNSVQLRNTALSSAEMRAIGSATAAGIPQEIPPIPSGVETWFPSGAYASRNTIVGALLAQGSAIVDPESINLSLNGAPVAGATVTPEGDFIRIVSPAQNLTPGQTYALTVSYNDNTGAKSFSREFNAAIFFEDFESVTLGSSVEERVPADDVWTNVPPVGWSVIRTNMPGFDSEDADGDGRPDGDGMSEWFGWAFAKKDWWVLTAEDQRRSEFSLASGVVAVADPDEWDDASHSVGLYNTLLRTPEISLAGIAPNTAFIRFHSSWRPEAHDDGGGGFPEGNINNQTAIITVSYNGGERIQVLKWDSDDGSATFHADQPNEIVTIPLNNPSTAQTMVIDFSMVEAANDWWWAIDDLVVSAGAAPPSISSQPISMEVAEGQPAALEIGANGSALAYQWYKGTGTGRTPVQGAIGATFAIPAVSIADAGYYSVEVKNSVGTLVSGLARISVLPTSVGRMVLLDENFDSLPLGSSIDERLARDGVWTKTPPVGWSIDDTGVPGVGTDEDGVTEWAGWSFANRAWWAETAENQNRGQFTKGTGTSAIADSDEWDDVAHASGNMETLLKTKSISLAGVKPNSVILRYDSSWRAEEPQKASVAVSFDGGAPVEVIRYTSNPNDPSYRPDEVNETIAIPIPNPAGAQNMQIIFRYFDTRNNWWWAIDNVRVLAQAAPVFYEDFEGLVLGPNVDEALAGTAVWTSTPPAGWSVDNTGTPGLNDPAVGVREWEGWNFANRAWWAQTAGDQDRAKFLKGIGTVAIADGDEWDDKGDAADLGKMSTFMSTRPINIAGQAANSLTLKFDSSWRDEPVQKANIRVAYDGGTPVEVLRWEDSGANHHDDAPNETVTVPLRNPAGAQNMVITFGYFDAGNNWWWAIDNIEVIAGTSTGGDVRITRVTPNGGNILIAVSGSGNLALEKKTRLSDAAWSPVTATAVSGVFTVPADGQTGFFRVVRAQ